MPRTPKTKEKVTLSIDKSILRTIRKKSNENGNNISQQVEQALKLVFYSEETYLTAELERSAEALEIAKFRATKYNQRRNAVKTLRKIITRAK